MSNIVAGFAERAVRTARHDARSRRVALRFADARCCRSGRPSAVFIR
jgi:predicted AAA+ superfamily ATPase